MPTKPEGPQPAQCADTCWDSTTLQLVQDKDFEPTTLTLLATLAQACPNAWQGLHAAVSPELRSLFDERIPGLKVIEPGCQDLSTGPDVPVTLDFDSIFEMCKQKGCLPAASLAAGSARQVGGRGGDLHVGLATRPFGPVDEQGDTKSGPTDLGVWRGLLKLPGISWLRLDGTPTDSTALPPEIAARVNDLIADLSTDCEALVETLRSLDVLVTQDPWLAQVSAVLGIESWLVCAGETYCPVRDDRRIREALPNLKPAGTSRGSFGDALQIVRFALQAAVQNVSAGPENGGPDGQDGVTGIIQGERGRQTLVYRVGKSRSVAHGSWFRGEHCNFAPSKANLEEPGAITRYVLDGWLPAEPFITRDSRITAFGSCFAQNISNHLRNRGYNVLTRGDLDAYVITCGEGIVNSFAVRQQF